MKVQIGKRQLFYELTGSGQPLVFCHGFGGNHVVWCQQVAAYQDRYQVLTFDQAGHGESGTSFANSIYDLIEDTAALIKKLGLQQPILVGHSMGASVVWGLLKLHPELKIKKFVIVDQSPYMLNTPAWPYGYLDLTKTNYKQALTSNRHVKETLHGLDDQVWQQLAPFKKQYPFARKENLPLLFNHVVQDWRPVAYTTQVKGLMICSRKSPYFTNIGYTQQIQAKNKNTSIALVDDTGHDVMAEQPAEFNGLLTEFLES
jgi:non-heme chloroperoxidase